MTIENKKKHMNLTIVIPAYNEEEVLPTFLQKLKAYLNKAGNENVSAIIVNDGSKDKTKAILDSEKHVKIRVIHHKLNRGYGGALKSGILASNAEYTITIDADGQHRFEDVDRLYNLIKQKKADMIVGSRRETSKQSKFRLLGKWIIRRTAKILMPLPIYDINSGMKIYDTELAQKYLKLMPDGMAFSDIMTLVFIHNRHLVIEEEIKIEHRQGGKSTIGVKTALHTLMEIVNIVVMFNPLRIFLPLSLMLLLFGVGWGSFFIIKGHGLSVAAAFALIASLFIFLLGLIAEQLAQVRKNQ